MLYVSDKWTYRVCVFDTTTLRLVRTIGERGPACGRFSAGPCALAVMSEVLHVAEAARDGEME